MSLKNADMEYTKSLLTTDSYFAYWYYWIHQVGHRKDHPVSVVWEDDGVSNSLSIAPLFQLHHHILYCSVVIVVSVWILNRCGFKYWEKY
jgi:hypothetical protein